MALVKKTNRTLQHPTEAETTIVVRVPLSAGDLEQMRADGSQIAMSLDLATEVIQEWSYPEPVTLDNVRALDLDTFTWLTKEIMAASGIRDDEEKKDSASASSPTSAPAAESSPPSSGT